jgi:hypothetical protein
MHMRDLGATALSILWFVSSEPHMVTLLPGFFMVSGSQAILIVYRSNGSSGTCSPAGELHSSCEGACCRDLQVTGCLWPCLEGYTMIQIN